jgi:hypothetical protein
MNIPYFLVTDFRRYGTGKRGQPPKAAALVVKTTPAKRAPYENRGPESSGAGNPSLADWILIPYRINGLSFVSMVDLLLCALSTIFILDGATDKWHGGLVSNRRYPLSLRKNNFLHNVSRGWV